MAQMQNTSYDAWIGRDAYDSTGDKIGEIKDIFYDDVTGRPEWVSIKTGLFKGHSFVPIHGSSVYRQGDVGDDDALQLAFTKDMIKDAPRIDDDDDAMDPAQEQQLWTYYGYDYNADPKLKTAGYGSAYQRNRADKEYQVRPYDREKRTWSDTEQTWAARPDHQGQAMEEHTEEVPVKTTAQVEVPVDTTVRLRRYQTKEQKTRVVEIPYEETTEHAEVADIEARAGQPTTASGSAEVGKGKISSDRR
jgi:hypothetical protein